MQYNKKPEKLIANCSQHRVVTTNNQSKEMIEEQKRVHKNTVYNCFNKRAKGELTKKLHLCFL